MSETPSVLLESDTPPEELAVRYPHVMAGLLETPWAITEPMRDVVVAIAARRIAGEKLTRIEIEEAIDGRPAHREPVMISYDIAAGRTGNVRSKPTSGQIAVLPFYGVMAPRLSGMASMSGGTSVTSYMEQLKQVIADPDVSAILLDIDSPGGSSAMIAELGQLIYDARGEKPIAAIANTMAGSAAFWVATQADEFAVTPSGSIGSVGVYGMHQDLSAALERAGIKTTVIQAGQYKTELHPFGPLSEEALAYHQGVVDSVHEMFLDAVARGRGTTTKDVAENFGQGRMLQAKPAVAAGMADRVATFDQMVDRLARGKVAMKPTRGTVASGQHLELAAEELPEGEGPRDASSVTGAARLDALLEGATLGAIPAGASVVLQLGRPLDADQLTELTEHLVAAMPGRTITVLEHDLKITADEEPPTDLPATAGETHAGDRLLHRRAVRAALNTTEGGST